MEVKKVNRQQVLDRIEDEKLVAIVRTDSPDDIEPVVDALLEGGIRIIEVTFTIPDVISRIPALIKRTEDGMLLGMGSVLNRKMATQAAESGVSFIVSPIMKKEIIETAHEHNIAVCTGAYSPTEIQTSWEYGSDIVKVFPADGLGPSYIKGVRAPMPHLRLMPTGGVKANNIGDWLGAGSFALGVGSALVDMKAIKARRFDILTEKARTFVDAISKS